MLGAVSLQVSGVLARGAQKQWGTQAQGGELVRYQVGSRPPASEYNDRHGWFEVKFEICFSKITAFRCID